MTIYDYITSGTGCFLDDLDFDTHGCLDVVPCPDTSLSSRMRPLPQLDETNVLHLDKNGDIICPLIYPALNQF